MKISFSQLFSSFSKIIKKGKKELLLTPGPVSLNSSVRKALAQQMKHHRSQEFKTLFKGVSLKLKKIFQTKEPVLILHSTGTGAMEAALTNTLSPKEEILCLCAGKFGERWRDIAQSFDLETHCLTIPWGEAFDPQQIKNKLEENKNIRALLISACETSTATDQPIKEISQILKLYPHVLFIVDGITAVGARELPMDEWGIDVLIAGSQKSFMIPAGLSFIAFSKKAWQAKQNSTCPNYYFDLEKEKNAQSQGQTAFSSSFTLISALNKSLNIIEKKGLNFYILRCQILKKSCHVFCKTLGLKLYSSNPANSVTAIQIPKKLSAQELKKNLQKKHRIVLASGQDLLKDKVLRIGHLGPISDSDHLRALQALALEFQKLSPSFFSQKKIKIALQQAKSILQSKE